MSDAIALLLNDCLSLEGVSDTRSISEIRVLSEEGVVAKRRICLCAWLATEGVGENPGTFEPAPYSPIFIDKVFIEKDGSRSRGFDERDAKNIEMDEPFDELRVEGVPTVIP